MFVKCVEAACEHEVHVDEQSAVAIADAQQCCNGFSTVARHDRAVQFPSDRHQEHHEVAEHPCGGSSTLNDQWIPVYLRHVRGVDWYNLVSRRSHRCLNVQGASQASGADLIQFTCSSDDNSAFTWQDGLIIGP